MDNSALVGKKFQKYLQYLRKQFLLQLFVFQDALCRKLHSFSKKNLFFLSKNNLNNCLLETPETIEGGN